MDTKDIDTDEDANRYASHSIAVFVLWRKMSFIAVVAHPARRQLLAHEDRCTIVLLDLRRDIGLQTCKSLRCLLGAFHRHRRAAGIRASTWSSSPSE